jgi:ABC-type branched-subunit amino acid transport system substrate-binding protein
VAWAQRARLVAAFNSGFHTYASAGGWFDHGRAAPSWWWWWNHGGGTARLTRRSFPRVVNVPATASTYLAAVLVAVGPSVMAGRRALLVHSSTGFGQEVAAGAARAAGGLGLVVTDIVFEPGGGAAVADDALVRWPAIDVVLVAGAFHDELGIADRLLRRPWRTAAFVSAGVDEVPQPLAGRLEGVYGPCQWLPEVGAEPEEGPDRRWFIAAYQRAAGTAPAYPAAAAFAAGVIWQRCVPDAGTAEPDAVAAVASRLVTTTLFGAFRLHSATGLQDGHRVGVVRWHEGRRVPLIPPV